MACEYLTSQIIRVEELVPSGNARRHVLEEKIPYGICLISGRACIFPQGTEPSDKKDCGYLMSLVVNQIPVPFR